MAGYHAAMKSLRLPIPRKLTVASEQIEPARMVMEQALHRGRTMTAVFCINDSLALGALQAAKAVGLSIEVQEARDSIGLDNAFSVISARHTAAVFLLTDPMFFAQRKQIAQLA